MKIKSFKVKDFQDNNMVCSIDVPMGSFYRDMKLFHDGIYAFFEVPELVMEGAKEDRHTYRLIGINDSIPNNCTFMCIIDVIIEVPPKDGETVPQQAIQIIPIYRINES